MDNTLRKKSYTVRSSYMINAEHCNDKFLNLGYNYRGRILRNGTSPEIWKNPLQIPFYARLESFLVFLIEEVKTIKKTFSIAHNKNDITLN